MSKINKNTLSSILIILFSSWYSLPSHPEEVAPDYVTQQLLNAVEPSNTVINQNSIVSSVSLQTANEPRFSVGDPVAVYQNLSEFIYNRQKVSEEITAETSELFGERIDLNTGSVSMQQTDISIPGNSQLPVALHRSYRGALYTHATALNFGDWQLSIPSITTVMAYTGYKFSGSWGAGKACSGPLNPGYLNNGLTHIYPGDYWSGDFLDIPGGIHARLLEPKDGSSTRYVRGWRINCISTSFGEGFQVTSPEGVTYQFDQLRLVEARPFDKVMAETNQDVQVRRFNAFMQVSRITDRFNNWVEYRYDSADPSKVTEISSNDGRSIVFEYEQGTSKSRIKKATAGDQVWTYSYVNASGLHYVDRLQKVTRPDGKFWQYDLNIASYNTLLTNTTQRIESYETQCLAFSSSPVAEASTVVHPSGAKLRLERTAIRFGRSNVPVIRNGNFNTYDRCFGAFALTKKVLTIPSDGDHVWSYSYSQNPGQYVDGNNNGGNSAQSLSGLPSVVEGYNAMDLRSTTVVSPDGSKTVHVFDRRWGSATEGMEIASYSYDINGVTLLQEINRRYLVTASGASAQMTSNLPDKKNYYSAALYTFENEAPHNNWVDLSIQKIVTYVNGVATDTYTTEYSNYNAYGKAQQIKETNSFGKARYTRYSYFNDTTNWVLNLPETRALSTDNVTYTLTDELSYYDATNVAKALLATRKEFGQLIYTNTYHSNGLLKLQSFNLTNRWIEFSDYKRGRPQLIRLPLRYSNCSTPSICSMSSVSVINYDGTVSSITDFNGNTISYSYDDLNRLTNIDYADDLWADTTITYTDGNTNGQTIQTLIRNNYKKVITLDALMRPVLHMEKDITNDTTTRYQVRSFNIYGKETFASILSANDNETVGSYISYDGLQRITRQTYTPQGDLIYQYLSGNKLQVTNGRGYITTTTYQAYGIPEQKLPTTIMQPESVSTSIDYNLFDNVTSIVQGGIAEHRYYNSQQQLCLQRRPDIGITAYQYNTLGQVTRYAEGLLGEGTNCTNYINVPTAWVDNTYDNHGYLQNILYADGSPTKSYMLDNNGNVVKLSSGSGASAVVWDYSYNSKNLPESETLTVDNQSWIMEQAYDSLGHLKSQVYPSGDTISYAPNALGQATEAGHYASSATYHPNGQLKSFSYGNGLIFSQSQDSAYRPYERQVKSGSSLIVGQRYSYDANENLSAIADLVNSSKSISLGFDGLDRLTSASGYWGSGSLTYDAVGNIKTKTLGAQALTYSYNSNNQLSSVTGGYSFSYDGRGSITNNGKRSFTVNRANQMTSSGSVSYAYDGHNRRVKKVSGSTTQYSFYTKNGQFLSTTGQNGPTEYVYLGNQLVAQVSQVATADDKPGYTGHLEDKDIGLTYMQQRYYDPVIGRFYSNDPVGFSADNPMMFNRYAYANNNPYKFTDPDGKEPLSQVFAQAFGYSNATQANLNAPSDMKAAANQMAADLKQDASVGLQVVSDVTGTAGIGAIALGPEAAPISAGLLAVSGATSVAAAALSNDPLKNVAIEVATNVGPGKLLGSTSDMIKGVANIEKGSGGQMAIDTVKEVSNKQLGDKLKQEINEK